MWVQGSDPVRVAAIRGLLLDLLAGGDEARVHAAAEAYLATR